MSMRKLSFILILSLSGLVLFSCGSRKKIASEATAPPPVDPKASQRNVEKIKALYVEASKEMIRGEYDEAEKLFQQVLDLDPSNHASRYNLAKLSLEERRLDNALNYAQQAVAGDPENYWYRHLQRRIHEIKGEYGKAIAAQEEMLNRFPDKPEDRLYLSSLYLREANPRKALEQLAILEERYGVNEEIGQRRYDIYADLGEKEDALATAKGLIELDPLETRYYQMAYNQLVNLRRSDEAAALLENLLKEDPDNGFALLSLADYYKRKDQLEKSDEYLFLAFQNPDINPEGKLKIINGLMQYLEEEPELRPRLQRLIDLFNQTHPSNAGGVSAQGQLFLASGQADSARANYRRALDLEPSDLTGWVNLIRLSLIAQNYQQMFEDAEEARSYFPNQDQILFLYGFAAARLDRYRPAASALEKVIRIGAAGDELISQTHAELGYVYHQQGDYEASDENFDAALELTPNNPLLLNNYAYYLAERGEKLDQAKSMSERALKQSPNESTFLDTYGWVLYKRGDYRGASKQLEKAVEKNPTATSLEHYGDALFRLGEEAEAVNQWKRAIEAGASFDLEAKRGEFK